MDNSLVYAFEGYVKALYEDIKPTYCSIHDWERDKTRSLHELANRGLRFLTIDLPALRKHFDKCLEEGLYTPSHLFLSSRVSRRIQVPAYGRDLYLQIFDQQGKLRPEPNVYAIADLRQLFEGVGKLFQLCKQEAIDDEIQNFISIEGKLRSPSFAWDGDDLFENQHPHSISFQNSVAVSDSWSNETPYLVDPDDKSLSLSDATHLQMVCDIISSQLGDFHLEQDDEKVTERPKHGSGRVSNLHRHHSKNDFSYWPAKLDRIFPYDWYATYDLGHSAYQDNHFAKVLINHEHPSKLIAVPKTMSGPRLIGSEPNYHQWIQQLVLRQIVSRVKRSVLRNSVSFDDQTHNADLALSSSRTRDYVTVDLKSASDRLSSWTIERVFRSNKTFLERIHASRTRVIRGELRGVPFSLRLKKCFSQGSACTFPVQTLVYSMVAIASTIISNGWTVNSKNITRASKLVRVFGDDIIVQTQTLQKLTEILQYLQLEVNTSKTFYKGKFRESCGTDAFDGVDVTPARIRAFSVNPSHEVAISMLEGSNNFFKRGMWHTSLWMQSHLRKYNFPIVAHGHSREYHGHLATRDSGGLVSFCGENYSHLPNRYNKSLYRYEAKFHYLVSNSKKVLTQSAHDATEFLFGSKPFQHRLDYLNPSDGGLGVVNKNASVMKQGWRPIVTQDYSLVG